MLNMIICIYEFVLSILFLTSLIILFSFHHICCCCCPFAAVAKKFPNLWDSKGILILIRL